MGNGGGQGLPTLPAKHADAGPAPAGVRRFQSRYGHHRISVKHVPNHIVDGRLMEGESLVVQFEGTLFQTSNPELVAAIEASESFQRGECWDRDARDARKREESVEQFLSQVDSLPEELRSKVRERLSIGADAGDDFKPAPSAITGA